MSAVRQLAAAESVHARTVYRWIAKGLASPRRAVVLPLELIALLAECRGNVARTHARAVYELGYPHTRRHLARQFRVALSPAELAMLREGEDGYRRFTVYSRWEAEHRNQIWEIDSWEMPVWVRVERGTKVFKPWVVVIVDAYSRVLLSGTPTRGRPTQADVLVALYEAISPRTSSWFRGKPAMVRWDNGMEFLGDVITQLAQNLGFSARSVRAWAPFLKGKVERVLRTIEQQFVSDLPGYLRGPRREDKTRFDAGGSALTLNELARLLRAYIDTYNLEHRHASLGGRTPLEMWQNDPTPIDEVDEAELRWMLPRETAKITKHGVRYRNQWYFAPEIHGYVGKSVEVAYCPSDSRSIDIYRDGKWWATAVAQPKLTNAARRQGLEDRRRRHDWIQDVVADASRKKRVAYGLEAEFPESEAGVENGDSDGFGMQKDLDQALRSAARTNLLGISDDIAPLAEDGDS